MSIEKQIIQALQQKVIAAVAASTIPTLPIKFLGVPFSPPDNQKWIELVFIPNNRSDATWGDEEYHRGVMRIILHWPNNGSGSYTPLDYIGAIGNSFTKSSKIGGLLTLLNKPKLMSPIEAGLEILYPLSVEYSLFET